MFIAALFIIARIWKQPKCPSIDEWINTLSYIQTVDDYSVIKITELPTYEKTQMNLKYILLRERIQSEKAIYCIIPTI